MEDLEVVLSMNWWIGEGWVELWCVSIHAFSVTDCMSHEYDYMFKGDIGEKHFLLNILIDEPMMADSTHYQTK